MTEKEILGFDPNELNIFFRKEASEKTKTKIYLAGKISSVRDWRGMIMGNYYRVCSIDDYDRIHNGKNKAIDYLANEAIEEIPGIENTYITGPFFISCDHSCYHGANSHGLGLHQIGCNEGDDLVFGDWQVKWICLRQIDRADFLFAYIDSPDCYGTLHEIAYAQAKGKPTVIVFATPELRQQMWFSCADSLELTKDECKYDSVISQKMGYESCLMGSEMTKNVHTLLKRIGTK